MKKSKLAMAGICLFVLAGMICLALDDLGTGNGKNQGKKEANGSGENVIANEVTDGMLEEEENPDSERESIEADASLNRTEQAEESEVSETQEKEVTFDELKDIGEYQWVYYSRMDLDDEWDGDDEWDLPYVDDETFEMLLAAYAKIDFNGEFQRGNPELYDEYREKYWQMLQNNGPVMDKESGDIMSLTDFLDGYTFYHFDHYNWEEFDYFFYDVDGDGAPELGICSFTHFIYLFDYDEETDRFSVWYEMEGCYYQQVGTRKVMWRTDKNFAFYLLDENGDVACETFYFYCVQSGRDSTRFLNIVMLPFYADETEKIAVTQGMKENGIYVCYGGDWYFRLTDEQEERFADVYAAYNEAYETAYQKNDDICYRYEELFGDFIQ